MREDGLLGMVARQDWLEPAEEAFQRVLAASFNAGGETGQKVADLFHGTWLGHPLHAALTDIPLGAWSAAVVLDFIDSVNSTAELRYAADACVGIGVAGAACAAVTGLTDWHKIDPPARRVGLVHGLANIAVTSLFTGSWIARRRGSRALGKSLALAGIALGTVSAWLGGSLVYDEKIGVTHSSDAGLPQEFKPVLAESELKDGSQKRIELDGNAVLLVRRGNRIFAIADTCSHLGGPLSEGKIEGETVQCPWHASRFSLESGKVLAGPAVHPQPCLEARVRNGQVELRRMRPGAHPPQQVPGATQIPDYRVSMGPEPAQSSVQTMTEVRRQA